MAFIQPQPDGTYDLMIDQTILGSTYSVLHSRYKTVEDAQAARDKLADNPAPQKV
jgi:hypothetical protein